MSLRTFAEGETGFAYQYDGELVAIGDYGKGGFILAEMDGAQTTHATAMLAYVYLSAKIRAILREQAQSRAIG